MEATAISGTKVLVVDDDRASLDAVMEFLRDESYEITSVNSGMDAWAMLERHPNRFDAVLLDTVTPELDGLEVLRRMKAHSHLDVIPVVLQTPRSTPEDLVKAIDAGATYYLPKPLEHDLLRSTLRAAIDDGKRYRSLREAVEHNQWMFDLLDAATFSFRTLEEAEALATCLAQACPDPSQTVLGLIELMINAVEHGNLAISYEDKTALREDGIWLSEIQRRLKLPENRSKSVTVEFARTDEAIRFVIRDQGAGFDWRPYIFIDPQRAFDTHGRGIAFSTHLVFDRVTYLGRGNEVLCEVLTST